MEVHHHAHPSTSSGHRKKWTHFFWEFFMLFLAVFCGYLAEYQLEHKIEKNREKQYIHSLLKDLDNDTLQFENTMQKLERKIPYYDSVLGFLENPSLYDHALPFRFYIKTNLEQFYSPAKPTLEQLRGSGNLRLIHKQYIIDSIVGYDSRLNGVYKNQVDYVIMANKRIIQEGERVFNYAHFNRFISDVYADSSAADPAVYDIRLSIENRDDIRQAANIYITAKATDIFYLQILVGTKALATQLIQFLKKEYHIK